MLPYLELRGHFCKAFKKVTENLPDDINTRLRVEFIIPTPLLSSGVELWPVSDGYFAEASHCGHAYPTVVRPYERMEASLRICLLEKWDSFKRYDPTGPNFRWFYPADIASASQMRTLFTSQVEKICSTGFEFDLSSYPSAVLIPLVISGVPLAVWMRTIGSDANNDNLARYILNPTPEASIYSLPTQVKMIRRGADEGTLGQRIVLMWDNPEHHPKTHIRYREPDAQPMPVREAVLA